MVYRKRRPIVSSVKAVHIGEDPRILGLPCRDEGLARDSNRMASSRVGASPSPVNRFIQMRSVASR